MRFYTLLSILSFTLVTSAAAKSACSPISKGGKLGPTGGITSTNTRTTTSTSTITVYHTYSTHSIPYSNSEASGELTTTKPSYVPTGGSTLQTSIASGVWTNSTTAALQTSAAIGTAVTSAAGLSTSAGVATPLPTSSLTAGVGKLNAGWTAGYLVGLVGVTAGLL